MTSPMSHETKDLLSEKSISHGSFSLKSVIPHPDSVHNNPRSPILRAELKYHFQR